MNKKFALFLISQLAFGTVALATDAPDLFKTASASNLKVLAAIKAEKLNCCDYRNEARCTELMEPSSNTKGIQVLAVKFDDGENVNIIPVTYADGAANSFHFSGIGNGFASYFEKIDDRTISQTDGSDVWAGKDGKKYKIESKRTTLDAATRGRPLNSNMGPSVCYMQSQMPDIQEFIDQEKNNDFWCHDSPGFDPVPATIGKVNICTKRVKCKENSLFAEMGEHSATCKMISVKGEWTCPPATYCYGDPSVVVNKAGKPELTNETVFPDLKRKRQSQQ